MESVGETIMIYTTLSTLGHDNPCIRPNLTGEEPESRGGALWALLSRSSPSSSPRSECMVSCGGAAWPVLQDETFQ